MTQPQIFYRAVPASGLELAGADSERRQLVGRLVPYDTVADVVDIRDGKLDIYREGFRRGAFDGQLVNGTRNKGVFTKVGLIHRHDGGLGYLGPFTHLREEADGLWGSVNILPSKADDVGSLLGDGVDELSIEFRLSGKDNTTTDDDGVRWRTRVHLDQVALEPKGAYSSAQVLQYRAELDELAAAEAAREQDERKEREAVDEEAHALEVVAAAKMERRQRLDEMTARIDGDMKRQQELVRQYGITAPPARFSQFPR